MRKREHLGQLELMVLLAVMRPARDAYGVLISRDIAEKSGREVALASVYAALERLERKGFLTSSLGEPTAERGGKARTYFKATAAGVREAREAHATLQRLSADVPALGGELHDQGATTDGQLAPPPSGTALSRRIAGRRPV